MATVNISASELQDFIEEQGNVSISASWCNGNIEIEVTIEEDMSYDDPDYISVDEVCDTDEYRGLEDENGRLKAQLEDLSLEKEELERQVANMGDQKERLDLRIKELEKALAVAQRPWFKIW